MRVERGREVSKVIWSSTSTNGLMYFENNLISWLISLACSSCTDPNIMIYSNILSIP